MGYKNVFNLYGGIFEWKNNGGKVVTNQNTATDNIHTFNKECSETKEGRELANKYGIQGYPTLLILDKNGKELTTQVGFVEPHILVNFGKRIVP